MRAVTRNNEKEVDLNRLARQEERLQREAVALNRSCRLGSNAGDIRHLYHISICTPLFRSSSLPSLRTPKLRRRTLLLLPLAQLHRTSSGHSITAEIWPVALLRCAVHNRLVQFPAGRAGGEAGRVRGTGWLVAVLGLSRHRDLQLTY